VTRRPSLLLLAVLVSCCSAALAAESVVEDWSSCPVGTRGIPPGWERQPWSKGTYDFTVVENDGHKVMHMRSVNDSSRICKVIKDTVVLDKTPILEWRWKVISLPISGDVRERRTDDKSAQIYVTWPRFPEALNSRVIGYIWNSVPTEQAIFKSHKSVMVTYIIVRSGPAGLGAWITERRNIREDYKMIYGEEPDDPAVITFGCDSNDTKSSAESFMGTIAFKGL
jgi:Protein of unknown function (DUF3047)